jgi:hypothetical protein
MAKPRILVPWILIYPTGQSVEQPLRIDYAVYTAVAGLPSGLSYDPAVKSIVGVPREPGKYPVIITAVNDEGSIENPVLVEITGERIDDPAEPIPSVAADIFVPEVSETPAPDATPPADSRPEDVLAAATAAGAPDAPADQGIEEAPARTVAEVEPVAEPEPVLEPEPVPGVEPIAEPEPAAPVELPEPEPVIEPVVIVEPSLEPVSESAPELPPALELVPSAEPVTIIEAQPEPLPAPVPEPAVVIEPQPGQDPVAEAPSAPQAEPVSVEAVTEPVPPAPAVVAPPAASVPPLAPPMISGKLRVHRAGKSLRRFRLIDPYR